MPTRRFLTASSATALALLAAVPLLTASPVSASNVITCAFSGLPSDSLTRGVVVPKYPGKNLRTLQLQYASEVSGLYRITLEVHRGTFNGPLLASQTVNVNLSGVTLGTPVFFDLGGAPVTPGDTLALVQTSSGPGPVFFDGGMAALPIDPQPPTSPDEAYETQDTTPPLSSYVKNRTGITIDQDDLSGACTPSDTVLCLDDQPGDRRFQVTVAYSTTQGGGRSGDGQATPLRSSGAAQGGMFWFFSPNNPEMLIKVLNSCAANNNFWIFFSAGTNVGMTVTVLDTATGHQKIYTNPDQTAAQPLQDVSGLPCS